MTAFCKFTLGFGLALLLACTAYAQRGTIASDRVELTRLPGAGEINRRASATFSYEATEDEITWRLYLRNIQQFEAAHLFRANTTPPQLVQHLVPDAPRDSLNPSINIGGFGRRYRGRFGVTELNKTLGVTSIREFVDNYIKQDVIYVAVNGPGGEAILQGYLEA